MASELTLYLRKRLWLHLYDEMIVKGRSGFSYFDVGVFLGGVDMEAVRRTIHERPPRYDIIQHIKDVLLDDYGIAGPQPTFNQYALTPAQEKAALIWSLDREPVKGVDAYGVECEKLSTLIGASREAVRAWDSVYRILSNDRRKQRADLDLIACYGVHSTVEPTPELAECALTPYLQKRLWLRLYDVTCLQGKAASPAEVGAFLGGVDAEQVRQACLEVERQETYQKRGIAGVLRVQFGITDPKPTSGQFALTPAEEKTALIWLSEHGYDARTLSDLLQVPKHTLWEWYDALDWNNLPSPAVAAKAALVTWYGLRPMEQAIPEPPAPRTWCTDEEAFETKQGQKALLSLFEVSRWCGPSPYRVLTARLRVELAFMRDAPLAARRDVEFHLTQIADRLDETYTTHAFRQYEWLKCQAMWPQWRSFSATDLPAVEAALKEQLNLLFDEIGEMWTYVPKPEDFTGEDHHRALETFQHAPGSTLRRKG